MIPPEAPIEAFFFFHRWAMAITCQAGNALKDCS
jgi:hypothetical protein